MRFLNYRTYLLIFVALTGLIGLSNFSPESVEDGTILLATNTRPLTDVKFKATPARIKRGEYLTNSSLMCFVCHSPRDTTKTGFPPDLSRKGGGVILRESKEERMVAPNITPDIETGAGSWTDDMLSRAIREGIGHDGRALSLPMYWSSFSNLSDEDLASVVVYLRTIAPVKNKLPTRFLSLEKEKILQPKSRPLLHPVDAPDLSDMLTRGRYLVKTADCVGCHSSFQPQARNPGYFGGGNRIRKINNPTSSVYSANLTPHETGLKGWTPDLFIQVMRTGKGDALNPAMPWVAYKSMTDQDLKAMFMALQTLPPVNHKVINGMEATYCEVCKQTHGYGQYNKIIPLKAVAFNRALYPDFVGTYAHPFGNLVEVKLENNRLLISQGGEPTELVPVSKNRFEASGFYSPFSFKRDKSGKVKWLISYAIEEEVLVKREEPKAAN
jgi:mono/diheme cytochrome c family protein